MASAFNPHPSPASNTTTTTTPLPSSPAMDSVIPLNIPISTKLSDSNFPTWQSQILPLLHGYNLARFVDSSPPDSTQMSASGAIEVNPAYIPWHRQDQLLLGWIRSSLTEQIQAEVVSCSSTRDLWLTLQRNYASTARSRITSLKRQIQSAQKGSLSCSAYLTQIRKVADELAFIGASVPEDELVTYAINGLGTDFNPVVAAINAVSQHTPFSFSDLRSLLLSHEAMIQSQDQPINAFYTGRVPSRPPNSGSQSSPNNLSLSSSSKPFTPLDFVTGGTIRILNGFPIHEGLPPLQLRPLLLKLIRLSLNRLSGFSTLERIIMSQMI